MYVRTASPAEININKILSISESVDCIEVEFESLQNEVGLVFVLFMIH